MATLRVSHNNRCHMSLNRETSILILGESSADTEVVSSVLRLEYQNLRTCSDPEAYCPIFDKVRPRVLVLSFKSLDTCESVYLNLHRRSAVLQGLVHKTVVLCSKEQVNQAYKLCHEGVFDDYVLFWPLVHDVKRLPMSVHLALTALEHMQVAQPWEEMAALARKAEQLGDRLAEQINKGRAFTESARSIATSAESAMSGALNKFAKNFVDSVIGDASLVQDHDRASREVRRIGDAVIAPAMEHLLEAQKPIRRWVETITDELQGPLDSARQLAQSANRLRQQILLVDDDEFVRRIVAHMLRQANLEVHAVSTIESARQMLKVSRPDLVLLDYLLPDGTGVDLLKELKQSAPLNKVPVVMLTGQSDRQVILDCLSHGASDFVVKPVQRNALITKVRGFVGH
jgi:PleD family two-component response regulator